MSKKIFAIAILVMMLFLMGCGKGNGNGGEGSEGGGQSNPGESSSGSTKGGVDEKNENGEYFFKATVTDVSNKKCLVVEVIESKIAFGTYHVLINSSTEFVGSDSVPINISDIKVGDTIEIIFDGKVMNSFPPQISAHKIILVK